MIAVSLVSLIETSLASILNQDSVYRGPRREEVDRRGGGGGGSRRRPDRHRMTGVMNGVTTR